MPPLQRFAIDKPDAGSRWSQRTYLHMLLPGSPPRMRRLAVALLVLTVPLVLAVSILTGLLVVQVGAGMVVVPVHDALHVAFLIVGWLVVLRNPVNPVGWLFLATAYFGLLTDVTGQYGMYNVLGPHPDVLPAGEVLLWIGSWIWVPALGVAPLTHRCSTLPCSHRNSSLSRCCDDQFNPSCARRSQGEGRSCVCRGPASEGSG